MPKVGTMATTRIGYILNANGLITDTVTFHIVKGKNPIWYGLRDSDRRPVRGNADELEQFDACRELRETYYLIHQNAWNGEKTPTPYWVDDVDKVALNGQSA